MKNQEKFIEDIKQVLIEPPADEEQLIKMAISTMKHYGVTEYRLGGKYTNTGEVESFKFILTNDEYEYVNKS